MRVRRSRGKNWDPANLKRRIMCFIRKGRGKDKKTLYSIGAGLKREKRGGLPGVPPRQERGAGEVK